MNNVSEEAQALLAILGSGKCYAAQPRPLIDIESIEDPFAKKLAKVKNNHTMSLPPKIMLKTNSSSFVVSG